MTNTIVYGTTYSVYVRIVRLALEEKHEDYDLIDVDIFADDPGPNAQRHPFHRIPTFHHDGFDLYETGAIVRYLDDAIPNPPLMPDEPKHRARVNQIISMLDNYAYPSWVWGLYVQLVSNPVEGRMTDDNIVEASITKAKTCLESIADLRPKNGTFLINDRVSLADIYAVPMYSYLTMTDIGRQLVADTDWPQWWENMRGRDSVVRTRFDDEISATKN